MIFFTANESGARKKVVIPSDAMLDRIKLAWLAEETKFNRVLIGPGLTASVGFHRAAINAFAGKTSLFATGPVDPLRLIDTFAVETIMLTPPQASSLLELIESQAGQWRLDCIKEVRIVGPLSTGLAERMQKRLCRNISTVYETSDAGLVALASYHLLAGIPNAVGTVIPGTRVEIVDQANTPLPTGEEGSIRVHSSFISKIFAANNPAHAAQAGDVWWDPGEVGRLTESGILCIGARQPI